MLDPFPSPPPLLAPVVRPFAEFFNLQTLSVHYHELAFALGFYYALGAYISPWLSSRLFPRVYPALPWRSRLSWDVHVVSLVQSTIISIAALWLMWSDEERAAMDFRERVWGYTGATGFMQALATAYFVWDLCVTAIHVDIFGYQMLAHAVSALYVFSFGYRPFVNFYAPVFILYELSSPFLNFHWFFDKLHMTGSDAQFYNGMVLIGSFFGSRLVWGIYQAFQVFGDVWKAMDYQKTIEGQIWLSAISSNVTAKVYSTVGAQPEAQLMSWGAQEVPLWLAVTYLGSHSLLTCLNIYWLGQMIKTVRARFDPPLGTKKSEPKKEVTMGRGLNGKGRKSVEVDLTEVKHRKNRQRGGSPDILPPQ